MPLHDWSRAPVNVFHSLHLAWIAELMRFLNQGGLPEGYLARAEEYVGPYQSDLLTLEVDARALATVPAEGRCVTSFERRVDPLEVRVCHCSLTLGQALPDVPLFLEPGVWVDVRLEPSYERTLSLLPRHDLKQLEADRS